MKEEGLQATKENSLSSLNTISVIKKLEILNKSIYENQKILSRKSKNRQINAKTKMKRQEVRFVLEKQVCERKQIKEEWKHFLKDQSLGQLEAQKVNNDKMVGIEGKKQRNEKNEYEEILKDEKKEQQKEDNKLSNPEIKKSLLIENISLDEDLKTIKEQYLTDVSRILKNAEEEERILNTNTKVNLKFQESYLQQEKSYQNCIKLFEESQTKIVTLINKIQKSREHLLRLETEIQELNEQTASLTHRFNYQYQVFGYGSCDTNCEELSSNELEFSTTQKEQRKSGFDISLRYIVENREKFLKNPRESEDSKTLFSKCLIALLKEEVEKEKQKEMVKEEQKKDEEEGDY